MEWTFLEQRQGKLDLSSLPVSQEPAWAGLPETVKPDGQRIYIGGQLGWPTHWRASETVRNATITYLVEYYGGADDQWGANLELAIPINGQVIPCLIFGNRVGDAETGKAQALETGAALKKILEHGIDATG